MRIFLSVLIATVLLGSVVYGAPPKNTAKKAKAKVAKNANAKEAKTKAPKTLKSMDASKKSKKSVKTSGKDPKVIKISPKWQPKKANPLFFDRALSISLQFGIAADVSGVSSAISNDGVLDINEDSLAANAGMSKLLMSDKDLATIFYSSQSTNAMPLKTLSDYKVGGALIGMDIGFTMMMDFLPWKVPVFVRTGFDYTTVISGGKQSLTLGGGPDAAAGASGFPVPSGGFAGGHADVTWKAMNIDTQLTFGFIWGVKGKGKIYAGLGLSYFYGGFSITIDANSKYVAFVTSVKGKPGLMVNRDLNEVVTFRTHGLSGNMLIGGEFVLWGPVSFYAEWYMAGAMTVEYAKTEFSGDAKKVMTVVMGGASAADLDDEFIERFAYPTLVGGSLIKFGVKYYII